MASDPADNPLVKASTTPAYRKVKRVTPESSPVTLRKRSSRSGARP